MAESQTEPPTEVNHVCRLSAGDLEMIADGELVGPWLFDEKPVYVTVGEFEVDKIESLELQADESD